MSLALSPIALIRPQHARMRAVPLSTHSKEESLILRAEAYGKRSGFFDDEKQSHEEDLRWLTIDKELVGYGAPAKVF